MEDKMGNLSTNRLMALLESDAKEGTRILSGNLLQQGASFDKQLRNLLKTHVMTVPQLIAKADLSKSYTYQLLRGEKRAGRDVVLRIAFALRLSLKETQRLLTVSGNSILYPRIRRDAALVFALGRNLSLSQTEELLLDLQEKALFSGGGYAWGILMLFYPPIKGIRWMIGYFLPPSHSIRFFPV